MAFKRSGVRFSYAPHLLLEMKRLFYIVLALVLASNAATSQDFAIPRPPAELKGAQNRAGWLVEHFWDNAPLGELAGDSMEQGFVNYISLFPIADCDSLCRCAVGHFMDRASHEGMASDFYALARKYLFELDSPMAEERYFDFFLSWAPNRRQMESILDNNREGSPVEEFCFECSDGSLKDFSQIEGRRLLLLYEIGCGDCMALIEKLRTAALSDALDGVTVVAVAVNSSREAFRNFAPSLPASWISGFDSTQTINGGAFAIRKLPDMYLVSGEGTVLKKHYKLQ